jgi:hypothetical protein
VILEVQELLLMVAMLIAQFKTDGTATVATTQPPILATKSAVMPSTSETLSAMIQTLQVAMAATPTAKSKMDGTVTFQPEGYLHRQPT